jgi:ketosteroid isomerase-like protein
VSDDTKAVVRAYYDALNRRDIDALMSIYTDDARTWVAGQGPFAGWHPVSREALEGFFKMFETLKFTLLDMTAEGERVALEIESEGTLQGAPYANQYHNLVVVKGGKVAVLKEYFDTARAGG